MRKLYAVIVATACNYFEFTFAVRVLGAYGLLKGSQTERYRAGPSTEPRSGVVVMPVNRHGGSVAERLACWTQAQYGPGSDHSRDAVG